MNSNYDPWDQPDEPEQSLIPHKTTLAKTLILESNCHPPEQYSVLVPYNYRSRQLDLGQVLYTIFQEIIPIGHNYQIFYYCSQSEYYMFGGMYPFEAYLLLGHEYASEPVITVKIVRVHPPLSLGQDQPQANKKKRINDRTIQDVLEKVAEWRNRCKSKGVTLEEAAKEIDLAKKTLDDYYYQIKLGEAYGFDFEANRGEKIGVLRKFVKDRHKKKPDRPLKILEKFMAEASDQPTNEHKAYKQAGMGEGDDMEQQDSQCSQEQQQQQQ